MLIVDRSVVRNQHCIGGNDLFLYNCYAEILRSRFLSLSALASDVDMPTLTSSIYLVSVISIVQR
jgi:hypothetical protein